MEAHRMRALVPDRKACLRVVITGLAYRTRVDQQHTVGQEHMDGLGQRRAFLFGLPHRFCIHGGYMAMLKPCNAYAIGLKLG